MSPTPLLSSSVLDCLYTRLIVVMSFCLSIYPSAQRNYVFLSVCMSVCLYICPSFLFFSVLLLLTIHILQPYCSRSTVFIRHLLRSRHVLSCRQAVSFTLCPFRFTVCLSVSSLLFHSRCLSLLFHSVSLCVSASTVLLSDCLVFPRALWILSCVFKQPVSLSRIIPVFPDSISAW